MTAIQQVPGPSSTRSATTKVRLTSLSVAAGASILAIYSFLGHAVDGGTLAPLPMEGATLSALHAAIPGRTDEQESPPTF